MGNKHSCCVYSSPRHNRGSKTRNGGRNGNVRDYNEDQYEPRDATNKRDESVGNLQHISEREPDDWEEDPSLHPTTETMFMGKSRQSIQSKFEIQQILRHDILMIYIIKVVINERCIN